MRGATLGADPAREGLGGLRLEAEVPVRRAVRYQVLVAERISSAAIAAFPEFVARHEGGGTALSGMVRDQARLHGLLAWIETLGLTLVELRRLPD